MKEHVVIKSFLIQKPRQTKIFEIRLPRGLEKIIGVELGFSIVEGKVADALSGSTDAGGRDDRFVFPLKIRRSISVGELRLQNISKANLFFAGELSIDYNVDNGDFTNQFFPAKVFSHQAHAFETEVKLTAKNRIIRGIFRDRLFENVGEPYKYKVSVYIWTTKKEKEDNK